MTNSSYKIVEINSMFKVILNPVPTSKSATLGFWCQGGSCKENDENNGIAHVLEHMMFKGTKTLTSKEIGRKLEKLGAYSNAYTSEESVCYYLSVGPTNLVVDGKNNLLSSMEILFDMFLNSVFPPEELEKEKDVIVQELRMYEDDLTSRCFANLHKIAYNPHTYLHREIIGTEENIRGFTSPQLIKFMEDYYNNIHFIMVGNFDEEKVLEFCKSQGDNFLKKFTNKNIVQEPVVYKKNFQLHTDIKSWANQAQCLMTWESCKTTDPELPIAQLIATIFGKGMSSILFEKVREDLGLVYGISAFNSDYFENGYFGVKFSTFNEKIDLVIDVVNNEMANFLQNLTDNQIETAKNFIISARIKKYENNYDRCLFLGEAAIRSGCDLNIENFITLCNKVTREDIEKFYYKYLSNPADKISKILIK